MHRQILKWLRLVRCCDNWPGQWVLVDRLVRNPVLHRFENLKFNTEFITDLILQRFQCRLLAFHAQLGQPQLQRAGSDQHSLQSSQGFFVRNAVALNLTQKILGSDDSLHMLESAVPHSVLIRNASQSIGQPLRARIV